MIYLAHIDFPSYAQEVNFVTGVKETCYGSFYPFDVLSRHGLQMIDFEPITILQGGNGSGKSTALNVIAERLKAKRDSLFNKTSFYDDYVRMCRINNSDVGMPNEVRIITSDDVFEFMLNIRALNDGIDVARNRLFEEYYATREASGFRMRSLDDYDELKAINEARRKSKSQYTRERLGSNIREQSNGESALMYFTDKMLDGGLYLLDEPENSLSPERQLELKAFIEDLAYDGGCQIIMATHSPFLLSMRGAKIYDMDDDPVSVKRWTELANVRAYRDFFEAHRDDFR